MSKADYLLKYLSQDPKPEKKSKKRKRKAGAAQDGLIIADDDAMGWEQDHSTTAAGDHDQDGPLTVSHRSAEFRKSKKNNWTTLSGAPATLPTSSNDDGSAADAILASAAAESRARQGEEDDEAPMLDDSGEKMASGARAGLTSGAQFAADMAAKRALEDADGSGGAMAGAKQETIYRDATGRIVNIAMKRAEARQKAAEKEAKKKAEVEDARGDVQRAEREKRKDRLADAKLMTVARYKDDEEMNDELRETERWNDPAAGFLTKKKDGKSVTGRPLYRGSAPPNRYGIRPGHMWDGVDRGTGFEGDWFKARNRVERLKDLDYAWQMDE